MLFMRRPKTPGQHSSAFRKRVRPENEPIPSTSSAMISTPSEIIPSQQRPSESLIDDKEDAETSSPKKKKKQI
jgi:hypothetical protein